MKVKTLIKILQALPQEKDVMCQIVKHDFPRMAWNVFFDFKDAPFNKQYVQLEITHPDLFGVLFTTDVAPIDDTQKDTKEKRGKDEDIPDQ